MRSCQEHHWWHSTIERSRCGHVLFCWLLCCCFQPTITDTADAACSTVLECVSRAGLYVSASDQGDRSFSLALYTKAVELDPSEKDAWLGIGAILQDRGDLKGSSKAFSNAMSADPCCWRVGLNVGNLAALSGQNALAARAFLHVIRCHPHTPQAYYSLGFLEMLQGRMDATCRWFKRAWGLKPDLHTLPGMEVALQGLASLALHRPACAIPAHSTEAAPALHDEERDARAWEAAYLRGSPLPSCDGIDILLVAGAGGGGGGGGGGAAAAAAAAGTEAGRRGGNGAGGGRGGGGVGAEGMGALREMVGGLHREFGPNCAHAVTVHVFDRGLSERERAEVQGWDLVVVHGGGAEEAAERASKGEAGKSVAAEVQAMWRQGTIGDGVVYLDLAVEVQRGEALLDLVRAAQQAPRTPRGQDGGGGVAVAVMEQRCGPWAVAVDLARGSVDVREVLGAVAEGGGGGGGGGGGPSEQRRFGECGRAEAGGKEAEEEEDEDAGGGAMRDARAWLGARATCIEGRGSELRYRGSEGGVLVLGTGAGAQAVTALLQRSRVRSVTSMLPDTNTTARRRRRRSAAEHWHATGDEDASRATRSLLGSAPAVVLVLEPPEPAPKPEPAPWAVDNAIENATAAAAAATHPLCHALEEAVCGAAGGLRSFGRAPHALRAVFGVALGGAAVPACVRRLAGRAAWFHLHLPLQSSAAMDPNILKQHDANPLVAAVGLLLWPAGDRALIPRRMCHLRSKTLDAAPVPDQRLSLPRELEERPRICLCVPTLSPEGVDDPRKLPLVELLLSSLVRTVTSSADGERFTFVAYIGYDLADPLFDLRSEEVRAAIDSITAGSAVFPLWFRFAPTKGGIAFLWNALMAAAFDDGCDFFYQLNDDVELISSGWAAKFVTALNQSPRHKHFGVVGGRDLSNQLVMTQSMVHRTHQEIFGAHFPRTIKNWHLDDWISTVYGPEATFHLDDVQIRNTNKFGTRYGECREDERWFRKEVVRGGRIISEWMSKEGNQVKQ